LTFSEAKPAGDRALENSLGNFRDMKVIRQREAQEAQDIQRYIQLVFKKF
jgi:hypothetical protein